MRKVYAWMAGVGAALLVVGGLLFMQGRAEAEARADYAMDNSTYDLAEALDIELNGYSPDPPPPSGDGKKAAGGTFLVLGGMLLLVGLVGRAATLAPDHPAASSSAAPPRPASTSGTPSRQSTPTTQQDSAGGEPDSSTATGGTAVAEDVERQPCPVCGERIAVSAKLCRFCRTELTSD